MLFKVTHCAGHVSTSTRPHQMRRGDREVGTATLVIHPLLSSSELAQIIASRQMPVLALHVLLNEADRIVGVEDG